MRFLIFGEKDNEYFYNFVSCVVLFLLCFYYYYRGLGNVEMIKVRFLF